MWGIEDEKMFWRRRGNTCRMEMEREQGVEWRRSGGEEEGGVVRQGVEERREER